MQPSLIPTAQQFPSITLFYPSPTFFTHFHSPQLTLTSSVSHLLAFFLTLSFQLRSEAIIKTRASMTRIDKHCHRTQALINHTQSQMRINSARKCPSYPNLQQLQANTSSDVCKSTMDSDREPHLYRLGNVDRTPTIPKSGVIPITKEHRKSNNAAHIPTQIRWFQPQEAKPTMNTTIVMPSVMNAQPLFVHDDESHFPQSPKDTPM